MFRNVLTISAMIALCATPAIAQSATDYLGVPGPLTIGDSEYELVWSSNPSPGYFKQEYLPAGAALETYDSMVIVEFLATDRPLSDVVAAQMSMIEQRKGTDPVANFAVFDNPDQGEMLLDFLLSAKDNTGEFIIEWNGYRYSEAELDGQKGSLLFALSERSYGNDNAEPFLRNLSTFKAERTLDLTRAQMPELQ